MENNFIFKNLEYIVSSDLIPLIKSNNLLVQWKSLGIVGGIFIDIISPNEEHLKEDYLDTLKLSLATIKNNCKKDKEFVEFLFSKKARHLCEFLLPIIKKQDKKQKHIFINKGSLSFFERYKK